MSAKTPEPSQEPASSTSSVPAQPKPAAAPTASEKTTPMAKPVPQPAKAPAPPAKAPAPPATVSAPPATVSAPPATVSAPPPAKAAPPAPGRPAPPPSVRRTGSGGAAIVVAVASLLVAFGATAVAVYALDVAREAKSQAAMAASASERAGGVEATRAPGPTAQPTPTPTPSPTPAAFEAELIRSEVLIPPAEGCASVFVDVDTLQVGVYAGHEFYVSECLGALTIRIDRKDGAVSTSVSPTPEACAAQLSGAAASPEIVLGVRAGLTFCLLTSRQDAAQQGIPQRLAIVEVRAVGLDQSVTAAVSTYRLPPQTTN